MPLNYDPNLTPDTVQHVVLTLAMWEYRAELHVMVNGNLLGFDVMKHAVEAAYDDVADTSERAGHPVPRVELVQPGTTPPEKMIVEDEDDRGANWLSELVIAAEIVSVAQSQAGG